ncbi:ABC transporter permease [Massilia arenosa]|uniref:ABC transporter permease n=1 Tax=Zemynaea arenosa TaxID=2561931 RepID=A0A4Y9S7Y5_9BURK|nr:ABC transporter permease [Massilia arenosa]TFW16193.1 ABC transporter permease [Massilia arenosa]
MTSRALVVLFKELREALRDKRALSLLALFVVMYPAIIGFTLNRIIDKAGSPEREGIQLTVVGSEYAPTLMAQLKQKNVIVTPHAPLDEQATTDLLRTAKTVAVLKIDAKFVENYAAMRPARVELWYDSAIDNGRKIDEVENVLREYTSRIAQARLLAHGVSPVTLVPVTVQKYDTGTSASRSAMIIGAMLGSFFIPAFIFCLSTAVDTTAGERERRSLEVLMAQPVSPAQLVFGKLGAATVLSAVGLTLELVIAHAILKWLPLEEIGLSWRLTTADLTFAILASLPLCLFAAAFEIALAMNAKSFKEAQSTLSFAILVPMLPLILIPMLDLQTATWMYAVPVLSNMTLLRELSKGADIGLLHYTLTAAGSLVVALLCYAFAAVRMKSEKYVLAV